MRRHDDLPEAAAAAELPQWVRVGAYCTDAERLLCVQLIEGNEITLTDEGYAIDTLQKPITKTVQDFAGGRVVEVTPDGDG